MPTESPSGPVTLPRTSRDDWLANGATTLPLHFESDGRVLVTLMMPPSAFRP